MTAFDNILKRLQTSEILLPYFENAMRVGEWPDKYTIEIDSSPYYGTGDGYFHPSTHSLMDERQLYYLFHPRTRHLAEQEDFSLPREMTVAAGTSLHAVVQTMMLKTGLVRPEDVEFEYVNHEHHVRGRIDFIAHHPTRGRVVCEMKALACSTPILTTAGWSTMGELRDGDEVYAPDGQPTKVVEAHPIRLNRPCYEMKFRDGQSVVADEDHLWRVWDRHVRPRRWRTLTTKELADASWSGQYRFAVPVTEPLQAPDVELPVDPWLLGYWLGDGDTRSPTLTCGEGDLSFVRGRLDELGCETQVGRYGSAAPKVYFYDHRDRMTALGVLGNKHIPDRYLRASHKQRQQLLAGLMDSDGTIGDHQASICMVNERVMRSVLQLVRSLGYRATWKRTCYGKPGSKPVYWVKFSARWGPSPFSLPRKRAKYEAAAAQGSGVDLRMNSIVAIDPVLTVPTRCITVAHESSLYVVGEGFIPTHNTINNYKFAKQTEPKPEWEAQLSMGLDAAGEEKGLILLVEMGYPFRMREIPVARNDELLGRIYAKFDRVREAIALDRAPIPCCAPNEARATSCPVRYACWSHPDGPQ